MHSQYIFEEREHWDQLRNSRNSLKDHDRSEILKVYFARLDGRTNEGHVDSEDLYQLDLSVLKDYLLGQYPPDPLLHKIVHIMN